MIARDKNLADQFDRSNVNNLYLTIYKLNIEAFESLGFALVSEH